MNTADPKEEQTTAASSKQVRRVNRVQHPAIAIALSRLREFIRRPETVFWVYFFPILMVIVLGVAFRNKPVESMAVDIVNGPRSEEIAKQLSSNPQLELTNSDEETARRRLKTGKTTLLVITNPADAEVPIEYHFDPQQPGSFIARDMVDREIQVAAGRTDLVTTQNVTATEPGGRYVDYLVPGLLGMGLMGGGLWGVGFAIVDMRIRKLLKRFMATPMRRSHFLSGIMLSRIVFMIPQVLILIFFSWLIFGFKVQGNWLSILFLVVLGAFEFAGIGLLVAARAKTLETVSGLMNLVMLPMWTLSGIFFSYERFPEIFHPIIRCLPLTPVIDALRAVMLDGKSILSCGTEILIITIWMLASFAVALIVFRWND